MVEIWPGLAGCDRVQQLGYNSNARDSLAHTAGFYDNRLLGYHSTHERFVMAIVGHCFAFMCTCEALNGTQLFPIIHQWSGFSLGRRLSQNLLQSAWCLLRCCKLWLLSVVLQVAKYLHIDQVARSYHSVKWRWLDWSNSSRLIQLIYHVYYPIDPNNAYKLNQSRTPPKLTFLKIWL